MPALFIRIFTCFSSGEKNKKNHTNCISDKTTGFKFKCFYSMPLIICSRGSGGAEQTGIYTSALQLVSPVCLKSPLLLKRHTSMLLKGKVDFKKKHIPLITTSAKALMDLVSDRSSFLMTTFSFPVSSKMSVRASSALSRSLHAMMMRAPTK